VVSCVYSLKRISMKTKTVTTKNLTQMTNLKAKYILQFATTATKESSAFVTSVEIVPITISANPARRKTVFTTPLTSSSRSALLSHLSLHL
jgi:hypothetical protein